MERIEQVIPTKQGQIVRIFKPLPGEDPNEDYLLSEDPTPYDSNRRLLVYSITEIQRAKHLGTAPFGDQIPKGDLTVVGESLTEWVESWNNK